MATGEPSDVQIGRLEERMVALIGEVRSMNERIDSYHAQIVGPMARRVEDHHVDIAVVKRDRFWTSGIMSVAITGIWHWLTSKPS